MAIAFVKDFTGSDGFGSSFTLTVPAGGVASGNHLILAAGSGESTFTISSITDSRSNTYSLNHVTASFGSYVLRVCSGYIGTALLAGDTITVTLGGATGGCAIASEFSGLASASYFDKSSSNVVVFDTPYTSNATATTTQADELVFGAHLTNDTSVTWTATSPFTITESATFFSAWNQAVQYRVVSATGTYASSGTMSAGCETANVVATFKAAAAGGTDATVTGVAAAGTAAVVAPPKPRPANPFSEINVRL